jgi:hypothetical protein
MRFMYLVDLEEGKIWPHGTGVALSADEARHAAREIALRFDVAPLAERAKPDPTGGTITYDEATDKARDPTAWEDDPPPHDDLSSPARPA